MNLLASAIWASGAYAIGRFFFKKSKGRTVTNNIRFRRPAPDYPPFYQGSYNTDTKVSLLDHYDLDTSFLKDHECG